MNEPLLSCKTTCAFSEMPTNDVEGQSQRRPATSPHETSERDWLKQNPDGRSLWPKDDAGVFLPLSRRLPAFTRTTMPGRNSCTQLPCQKSSLHRAVLKTMHDCRALLGTVQTYFLRWKGDGERHPPPPPIYRVSADYVTVLIAVCFSGYVYVHCVQWVKLLMILARL